MRVRVIGGAPFLWNKSWFERNSPNSLLRSAVADDG